MRPTRTGQRHRGIRQSQLGTCKHVFSFCEHTSKDQYFDLCHFLHLYLFFHLFLFFSCKNKNINHFMNMLSLCQHRKYAAYQHWTLGSGTHTQTHSPVRNGNTESHIIHICTHMHHQDYNLQFHELKWYEEKKPARCKIRWFLKSPKNSSTLTFTSRLPLNKTWEIMHGFWSHLHFSMCASVKFQTAYSSLLGFSYFRFWTRWEISNILIIAQTKY